MTPKGSFIRIGTAAEPMEQSMIDNFFACRVRNSIGRIKSNRQYLSFAQLRIYYDEKEKTLNDNFKKSLELLTDDGKYNYVAYLMSDENRNSVKVAKFSSLDKCELEENNEYGYNCLIKVVNKVLDKLEVENKTSTIINYPTREDIPIWDKKALREAVINAFVHNDYTYELSPTFEIYPDRLEIRSFGRLPETMTLEDFFTGTSMPRNKEIMRIFNDLNLVESLGMGIPRIVKAYGRSCFEFLENSLKMVFPISNITSMQDSMQDSDFVNKLIVVINGEMSREELQDLLNLSNRDYFRKKYLKEAIKLGYIEPTIPEKINSKYQKYRLTPKGYTYKKSLVKGGV